MSVEDIDPRDVEYRPAGRRLGGLIGTVRAFFTVPEVREAIATAMLAVGQHLLIGVADERAERIQELEGEAANLRVQLAGERERADRAEGLKVGHDVDPEADDDLDDEPDDRRVPPGDVIKDLTRENTAP